MARKKQDGVPPDVPGNAMETASQRQRFLMRVGQGWLDAVDAMHRLTGHDVIITGMSIRGEWDGHGDLLLVLRAEGPEGNIVAFHSTAEPLGLWTGLAARINNGSLKWRTDEYR